jgi:hypothetical protein
MVWPRPDCFRLPRISRRRWQWCEHLPPFLAPRGISFRFLVQLRVILSRFGLFRHHTTMIVPVRRIYYLLSLPPSSTCTILRQKGGDPIRPTSEKGAASALALGVLIRGDGCVTLLVLVKLPYVQRSLTKCLHCSLFAAVGILLDKVARWFSNHRCIPLRPLMMRGYFVQKRKHLHITASTTTGCKSQTSESHKSKFSPERDIHNYLFINLRSSTCPSENTRRRNHRTSPQLHASVGVWILALVQFLGGILGLARPPIHYHLPHHRKN